MKTFERNLLVILLLVSALLSISQLTRGHLWWDDFASYIMQAQSLLGGKMGEFIEHNRFTIENSSFPPGPIAYPWGFPALLAPVLAVFGLKVLALKLINTVFFLAFLFTFYRLARSRLPSGAALATTAILAFNPALLAANDLILSDIPFLFVSTLTIFLIEAKIHRSSGGGALATGLAIFLAYSLRANGLLLFIPLLISQALEARTSQASPGKWQLVAFPYLVFAGLWVLESLLLPFGQESYLSHFSMFSIAGLLGNLLYYAKLPADFFENIPLGPAFLILIGVFCLFEIVSNLRKNLAILGYIAVTLAVFVTWPETQGLRLIYPILPLVLLLAAEGFIHAGEKLPSNWHKVLRWAGLIGVAALILLSLGISSRHALSNLRQGREINGPFDPVSREMFEFIRSETPEDSIIVFFKPRVMRLLTGRDAYLAQQCASLSKGDYVVIHEKQGYNGQNGDVESCALNLQVVFNNKRFTVYKIPH